MRLSNCRFLISKRQPRLYQATETKEGVKHAH